MKKIERHLSNYLKSKELHDLGVKPVIGVGEYFYDELDQELYVGGNDLNGQIIAMNISTGMVVTLPSQRCIKAYLSSEIGEALPLDYTLPTNFEEGWALVSEDNDIILVDQDGWYETEVDARISYLIYFLKLKYMTPEELKL